jgi:hypothetical protein
MPHVPGALCVPGVRYIRDAARSGIRGVSLFTETPCQNTHTVKSGSRQRRSP